MKPLLIVLGLAVMAGAETHADLPRMLGQGLLGLVMVWLALRRGTWD